MQSIGNIKRHKTTKCYYCTHPNATQNRPSGKGQLVYSITDRYYNYYKSKIEDQNKSAKRKYKAFELTLEEFSDLVTKPCYCQLQTMYEISLEKGKLFLKKLNSMV
mgnify:CR=1 FL=1